MLYITLGDQPSGIYDGQVIDVCNFINTQFNVPVRLVSFISFRDFNQNKAKIMAKYPKATVIPMFPQLKNWVSNKFALAMVCLLTGERVAICRNVLATKLALSLKGSGLLKKVCFDGRGAIAAEWHEYNVVPDSELKKQIAELEKAAVLASDFRVAVSKMLVQYWREKYGYAANDQVVIPCTISTNFKTELPTEIEIAINRQEFGYGKEDVLLVYAGSTAGWQSFSLLQNFLSPLLATNENIKVLFLSIEDANNKSLKDSFPRQVDIQWVNPDEVNKYLTMADYGILLREETITNKVASPTKFAEYLISGLAVIISPSLGDYTVFVENYNCGFIMDGKTKFKPKQRDYQERWDNNRLAKAYFLKESKINMDSYGRIIKSLL
jgi:hypothetical protein